MDAPIKDPWQAVSLLYDTLEAVYRGGKVDPAQPSGRVWIANHLRKRIRVTLEHIPREWLAVRLVSDRPVRIAPDERVAELEAAVSQLLARSIRMSEYAVTVSEADMRRLRVAMGRLYAKPDEAKTA